MVTLQVVDHDSRALINCLNLSCMLINPVTIATPIKYALCPMRIYIARRLKRLSMRKSLTTNTYCSGVLARENCADKCRKHKIDMPMQQQYNRRPPQLTWAPKHMVQDPSMNKAARILFRRLLQGRESQWQTYKLRPKEHTHDYEPTQGRISAHPIPIDPVQWCSINSTSICK